MITFTEFISMKQRDITGKDIKKSEAAAKRAIITAIKENIIFIHDKNLKDKIDDFIKILMR